jgi:hypothetical protein
MQMTVFSFTAILESSDVNQVVYLRLPDKPATKHKHTELKLK